MLLGKTVVVGITGGIAAHYLPELIGQLRYRYMASVYPVMTPAAVHFVAPLTVTAAADAPVWLDIFEHAVTAPLTHIELARMADLVLIAPASYDFIGKVAAGWADDPVSLLLAATRAPVLLAPTMHDSMWANPILRRNLETRKTMAGYQVVAPETGLQAAGDVGEGRMAGIGRILSALDELASVSREQAREDAR
jgi:phosphopantothenoylcysteine decarboxylase/phosphopantothenate--cysteine ligase